MEECARYRRLIVLATAAAVCIAGCSEGGDTGSASETTASQPLPANNPPANNPPIISGTPPPSVKADEPYSFGPSASDPDGDTLTFSIQNQPSWASFDTSNGQISGTPTAGDVGNYANIVVSVTDGQATASTPTFSVAVTQIQLGSVTLSWTAPTQYSDGSHLNDLTAYKIYYGTSLGNYPNQIRVDNSGITTYVVDNLTPNTYFFTATAVNSQDLESDFASPAQVVVN